MLKKYDMIGRKLYIVFDDLEKAFDSVPKKIIWWALRKDMMKSKVLAIKKFILQIRI